MISQLPALLHKLKSLPILQPQDINPFAELSGRDVGSGGTGLYQLPDDGIYLIVDVENKKKLCNEIIFVFLHKK